MLDVWTGGELVLEKKDLGVIQRSKEELYWRSPKFWEQDKRKTLVGEICRNKSTFSFPSSAFSFYLGRRLSFNRILLVRNGVSSTAC